MKLKFKSTEQVKVFRSVDDEVDDMQDGDTQDFEENTGKVLLEDYPKNFIVVANIGEKIVGRVKEAVKPAEQEESKPAEIEDKAVISGRGRPRGGRG